MLRPALIRFAPRLLSARALLCAGLLWLSACSKGENGPCQIDGDCDAGLICFRARGGVRGTCENPKTLEEDSGAPREDAGVTPLPDAGQEDAGSEDAGTANP